MVSWYSLGRYTLLCIGLALLCCGCDTNQQTRSATKPITPLPAVAALGAEPGGAIIAQGQLQPRDGLVVISAPPGDRVAAIHVQEGQPVAKDQILVQLESVGIKQTELAVAEIQLTEARAAADAQGKVAVANLEVAKIGLQQAELRLAQAKGQQQRSEASGGQLDLLTQRVVIAQNKLQQLKDASQDPKAGKLISDSALKDHQLDVQTAQAELGKARHTANKAIELIALAVKEAEKKIAAAQQVIDSTAATNSFDSLKRKIDLLKLQVNSTQLRSPISAVVLSVTAKPGEATSGMPVMHLANLDVMVCKAEVNVAELSRVHRGALVSLVCGGIEPLNGRVTSISSMIGSPRLPKSNPLQPVDWRSVEVIVEIDAADTQRASQLINLQVDIAIAADSATRLPSS